MAPSRAKKPFARERNAPPDGPPAAEQASSLPTAHFDAITGARVDAQAGPSHEVPRSDKTLKHDTQQADAAKVISSVVAKEELDMVDPVASLAQDINEEVSDFPMEILSILASKIKEHFHNYSGKKLLTTTMGISIASSLFNILKDIYVACKAHTPGAKTLCILGILTSLCGLASSIATICHLHKCDFDLQAAMVHIKDVVRPHLEGPEPCAEVSALDKFKAWIPKIMSFIATSIAAGLSFLPQGSAVGTLIKNYGNSKKIGEDVSSMMTSFLTDVVGISLEGDPAYVDALVKLNKEGVELLTTPMHQFHIDMKKRSKLVTYPTRVDEATLHRTNNDTFKTLRMTLQSLQATRNQVVQRVQELFDCSQRTLRQEPVGIYLSGMGGIGKSYFAKELAQELHQECGYPEDIYCIDKCDQNFYEPYKGEATGIANEFMGRRAENEPLLRDINKICSEDYFNFEGAALHTKNQPCHLKAVLVTSNVKNPDLTRVQEPSVTAAMWSRFRRFEVMDPRFSTAEEARTNPRNLERGSEFLIFKEYVTDTNRNITEIKEWTAQEVKNYVIKECRKRERTYLNKIVNSDPYKLDEQGKKEIRERIAILDGLVPCARDGRVFVVRLEGPPGTGKTHFMEKCLIPTISNTFPALTLHRWSSASPLPNDGKPYLVVVDDTLDDSEKEYFDMVRNISNRSIIIIGTNTTTCPTTTWASATVGRLPLLGGVFRWAPAVEVSPIPGVPTGFWRRVGIADRVRIGTTEFEPYAGDCAHFRFYNGYIIKRDGKQLALEAVEEEILDKYIAFLQDAGDFIWSERRLNIEDPTVKIIARSYKDMVEVLSGSTGMTALVKCFARSGTSKPDPRMQIFLDPAFMQQVSNRVGTEEWRVPDRPLSGRTRLQIAEKISAFLRRLKPDATVVVQITNPGLDDGGQSTEPHLYELKGSMGFYTQSSLCAPRAQVTYDQHGVRIHATNEVVSYTECAMIDADHELPRCYKPATIRIIKQNTLQHPQVQHAKMVYTRRNNLRTAMLTEKVTSFFKHPAVITCLSIVGALALAGIIYGIYRACVRACASSDDEEEEIVPCDDTADSRDGTQRKAAAQALRKGSPPKNTKQQKAKFEAETRTQAEIDEWTNNYWFSLPGVTPYQAEFKNLSAGAKKVLKELADKSGVVPATVLPDMELKPHVDPRLSKLMDKLCHNLVTVCGHGNNYGLVFEGDILVTTGHTVAGLTDVRVRSKEFTGTAKVLKVSVPRDLAVLQLIKTDAGRRPPQFPSLRKHFLASLTQIDKMAWFVKPFTRNTVYVCGKMVTTPSYKCFSSHLSETFNPSEWIVTFFQYRMPWNPTLFQPGECGLPLFVEINGEYKICGIFNGACQNQNVIFASVTASDFNNTQGIVPSSFKTCAQIEYQSEAAGVPTFTANSFVIECFDSISYGNVTHTDAGYPQPIGHCTKLRAHSYPKHKALPLVPHNTSAPGGLENTQRLSCISESLSPDNVDIPRRTKFENGQRLPHSKEPLFLQIQKYNKAPGFKADKKLFAKAIAEVIHSYKLRIKKTTPLALLSVKQCINGVRGGALAGFQRDTGAGPTLRAKFNIMTKKDVLHQVRDDPPIHVLADNAAGRWVQNEVSEKLTSILNGVPVVLLTRACKKVEKIDKESWEKAKVRLFTECDFADNILLKILFGEMQSELASAEGTPLLLNMNPYTMPNTVAELMGHNLDNLVGTDISSMDKHFPRELIVAFVQIAGALYEWPHAVQRAIAATLMFPLQNFEGDVFTSPCGNLSGWFVTSLINCVAQELMIAYDRLKNLQGGEAPFDILRVPAEPYAILGDDKIQRLTPGRAAAQERSYLECGFVMQAGSKLQKKEERFCSRLVYKEDGKYYGALKLSAISGLVYFASSSELEAITPNFSLALFEAALHQDPKVYDKTLVAIKFVADYNGMQLTELASRERYRELYDQYCSGLASVLSFCGHRPDILSILEHCNMGDNARMALNQYAQQTKQALPAPQFKMEGPAHSPKWTVDLAFAGKTYVGTGESKSAAAEVAAKAALEQLRVTPTMDPVKEDIVVNNEVTSVISTVPNGYRIAVSRIENGIPREVTVLYRKNINSARRAAKHPGEQSILDLLAIAHLQFARKVGGKVCVWVDSNTAPPLKDHVRDGIRYQTDEEGTVYVLGVVMQQLMYSIVVGSLTQAGCTPAPDEHRIYYEPSDGPCMANDTPIQPENVQQATMNTGAMTIPQMSNPQPSGQAPSLAPPAEKIVSALEGVQSETLNPLGPPNMLAVGAVCFDLKDLVYSQYMDCDQQFIVTDDTPAGSVLLQIPYDPLGEWVNPYIRQYVSQHERYTGTLGFRITIVGNPTFSGLIGVAWQPRRVTTPTVNISEMQKYSYYGVTVELPSNKVIWLNDARQNLFWRSTLDASDVDSRPHLVVFNLLSLVSPLREGIQTRLRIASKLSNGGVDDGIGRNAFQVSLPIIAGTASSTRTAVNAQATRLADLVPEFSGKDVFMCTDGTAYSGNATAERGEALDAETRTYGGLHDQNKLFNAIPRPTSSEQDFGIAGVGQDYTPDPLRQGFNTFSLVLPPSPAVAVSEPEGPQTIVAWYETNNLPVSHYEKIAERVFATVQGPVTPSQAFDAFIERVSLTSTMADLDLLAIFGGPSVPAAENNEFAPPTTMIQNINWPLSLPTSQTRYGYALTTGHTTSYRGIKLVFRQGMMFIYQVTTTAQVSVGTVASRGPTALSPGSVVPRGTHACASNHLWQLAVPMPLKKNFPPWLVETQAAVASSPQLPAGWAKLSISPVVPSVVLPTIFGTTMLSSSALERALARRSAGLPPTQCLAFDIVDPVSNRRVCSARYLPESGDIVCSVPNTAQNNIYATYPANISEALLNNFGPIERSNAFVITDTTNWLTRKSTASLSHFQRTAPKGASELLDEAFGLPRISDIAPHASMAAMMAMQMGGGMLSGIGSGLSSIANQRHELNMQQNKFGHESNMLDKAHGFNLERDSQSHAFNLERDSQSHSFNLERDSQNHMFELERMLENFGYTNQLQAQQFQHNSDMSRQNFQQQQSMMFASSPNRALLGGATRGQSFA
ncbi:MAG: RNA helicase [Hangzhou sesamia inferens Solinvi-like virus 1]|nr:MAG: RNA helicase [Hangzhou sesamia inferens Solinvi-like virus 1]